jgi:gliding motility-associated-like protein
MVATHTTTTYEVTASVGSCFTKDGVVVTTVPYPFVDAGHDTAVCYNTAAQLNAIIDASTFTWAPLQTLNSSTILNPIVKPAATTAYILSAFDTKGCPKPGIDTITVTVLADISAFAGRDTSIVVGQPLQLNATGGITYLWSPSTGLSSTTIGNPFAVYNEPSPGIKYKLTAYNEGLCSDSAFITVKIFKTLPTIYVPTAFTPNGDGKNDVLKPVAAGMQKFEYFNIYNRWGQLIFNSGRESNGWDGTINGQLQQPGVFVWMVKGIDYTGTSYFKKGTVTVIR